jgi:transcriptional regulator GlxA family with amidase domain
MATSSIARPAKPASTLERHYSVQEIAQALNLSRDTITRIFRDEPGVLGISRQPNSRGTRAHTKLRIPQSVLDRVRRRLENSGR